MTYNFKVLNYCFSYRSFFKSIALVFLLTNLLNKKVNRMCVYRFHEALKPEMIQKLLTKPSATQKKADRRLIL